MRSKILLAVILLAVGLGVAASQLGGAFFFTLTGLEEVPVVSTVANAEFTVEIIDSPGTRKRIDYTLFYQNLEGKVTQAHIHVGQRGVNGGIEWIHVGNHSVVTPALSRGPPHFLRRPNGPRITPLHGCPG